MYGAAEFNLEEQFQLFVGNKLGEFWKLHPVCSVPKSAETIYRYSRVSICFIVLTALPLLRYIVDHKVEKIKVLVNGNMTHLHCLCRRNG